MKMKLFLLIFISISCSTYKEQSKKQIKNSSFKETERINRNDFNDFLTQDRKEMGHLFFDETTEFLDSNMESAEKNDELVSLTSLCRQKKTKEFTKAIKQLNKKFQKIPAFWNIVSSCFLEIGDFRKALLFLNQSLEISPDYAPALNNLGVFYLRQNLDQKALLAFEKSLTSSKFSKVPRFNLIKVYLKYGLVDLSRPVLKSLLLEYPNENRLIELLAFQSLFESDYKKSLELFLRLDAKSNTSTENLLAISFNYHQIKDFGNSQLYLSKINLKNLKGNQKFFFNYLKSEEGAK